MRDLPGLPPRFSIPAHRPHRRSLWGRRRPRFAVATIAVTRAFTRAMADPPRCPAALRVTQRPAAVDNAARLHNQAKLRALRQRRARMFNSSQRMTPASSSPTPKAQSRGGLSEAISGSTAMTAPGALCKVARIAAGIVAAGSDRNYRPGAPPDPATDERLLLGGEVAQARLVTGHKASERAVTDSVCVGRQGGDRANRRVAAQWGEFRSPSEHPL